MGSWFSHTNCPLYGIFTQHMYTYIYICQCILVNRYVYICVYIHVGIRMDCDMGSGFALTNYLVYGILSQHMCMSMYVG